MTPEQIVELQKSSPLPVYTAKEYFDNEELKQEQESEREQDAKL